MSDQDRDLSRRYRELPREEPPASIDAAIQARARRAVAPVRSRWIATASIAAVVVLALGVTLRMQHEQPGIENASMPAAAPPKIEDAPLPAPEAATIPAPASAPLPRPPPAKPSRPRAVEKPLAAPSAPAAQKRAVTGADAADAADASTASPELQLEGIAALREAGKSAEADDALARFRERFPAYRIPDATWQRVRPR